MKEIRPLSSLLFYASRLLSIFFLAVVCYALLVGLMHAMTGASWLPIQVKEGRFEIFYPFTRSVFLLGPYTTNFLLTYFTVVAFYGIFLWVLGNVFKAFRDTPLFTAVNVMRLIFFYRINIIIPIASLLLFGLLGDGVQDAIIITFLHLIIGTFAFFMATIFKQGLVLQEEQDLTF